MKDLYVIISNVLMKLNKTWLFMKFVIVYINVAATITSVVNKMSNKIFYAQADDKNSHKMFTRGIITIDKQRGFTERNSFIGKKSNFYSTK